MIKNSGENNRKQLFPINLSSASMEENDKHFLISFVHALLLHCFPLSKALHLWWSDGQSQSGSPLGVSMDFQIRSSTQSLEESLRNSQTRNQPLLNAIMTKGFIIFHFCGCNIILVNRKNQKCWSFMLSRQKIIMIKLCVGYDLELEHNMTCIWNREWI